VRPPFPSHACPLRCWRACSIAVACCSSAGPSSGSRPSPQRLPSFRPRGRLSCIPRPGPFPFGCCGCRRLGRRSWWAAPLGPFRHLRIPPPLSVDARLLL
jgi:hypothetical protein